MILLVLMAAMAMTGCGSALVMSGKQAMAGIHKGMTEKEVMATMGKPDFKRFTDNYEEWEYRNVGLVDDLTIIIGFDNGRVFMMNSFPTKERGRAYPCPPQGAYPTPPPVLPPYAEAPQAQKESAAIRLYRELKEIPFKDDQLKLLREQAPEMDFTCTECLKIMSLYTFDDDRLSMLRIMAPYIIDPENKQMIIDSMDFLSGEDEAKKIMKRAGIRLNRK